MALRGSDLRQDVIDLSEFALRDLSRIWRLGTDAPAVEQALRDLLPALIDEYGTISAAVAADWYDDLRDDLGVGGRFQAIPADIPDVGAQSLVGWAGSKSVDYATFQSLVEGGTQRRIANFARQTVTTSSIRDPRSRGWQRVGVGACRDGFCDMLIGRGAIYSESGADFAAHDNCKCQAVPAFEGEPRPVRPFTPTTRNVSDADRARTRAWLATQ